MYFEEETITPVLDTQGNVTHFIAIKLDITTRKQAESDLKRLARTDTLTGVNNRRHLFELAEHEFDVARRYGHPLSVIMFDLDHFKSINDTFGHALGDRMLERVTHIMRSQLRDVDLIGRYGGEEFLIMLPVTGAQQACLLAERIRSRVEAFRIETEKGTAFVTLSIGIAEMFHEPQETAVENVIRRADEAMYAAKQAGRNRTVIFDPIQQEQLNAPKKNSPKNGIYRRPDEQTLSPYVQGTFRGHAVDRSRNRGDSRRQSSRDKFLRVSS